MYVCIYLFIYFVCGLVKKSRALVCGIVTRLRTVRYWVQIVATSFFCSRTPTPVLRLT